MQYIDGLDKSVGLWRTLDRFVSIADKYISKFKKNMSVLFEYYCICIRAPFATNSCFTYMY